ncbi:DNA polymerase III subunit epsilon [Roseibium sp. RKSG952]|uniref:DNA polymerase III subunit epsilon n=1 Tax=Roseibium sp. RKSG952 TaxID=2529384 RepID=UPI0012BB4F04|nr:DNA polymerase III subunit epsilon [Roseibium sp. RKSG952]MTH96624.1 DNA polymerase III subunit epsilon [Roseibium sp. RKSG952]
MDLDKRYLVTDTETTGFDPTSGDRIVEIGMFELIGNRPTGRTFHRYVNPQGKKVGDSYKVHNLSDEFLGKQDSFRVMRDEFLEFIGDSTLVIHNAPFDMPFLNMELERANKGPLTNEVIDTIPLARKVLPKGSRVSLDALCNRFNIDASSRTYHGALIDADLLVSVFIKLTGMDQLDIGDPSQGGSEMSLAGVPVVPGRRHLASRPLFLPMESEMAAHSDFVSKLNPSIWSSILDQNG